MSAFALPQLVSVALIDLQIYEVQTNSELDMKVSF